MDTDPPATSPRTTGSLFEPLGENWLPTDYSRGPWNPEALHGAPVAALMVRALEALEAPVDMRLVRVTVELLRPVPPTPLAVGAEVVRSGKKVGLVEATVSRADDGTVLALARAQRIRTAALDLPDGVAESAPEVPEPVTREDLEVVRGSHDGYHNTGVQHAFVRGSFVKLGPVFDYIRLAVSVVPGEEPSPWQRVMAAADFGNGISTVVPFGKGLFINPDLTVHLLREPVGEWVGMESTMRTSPTGIGMSDSALWDTEGFIGRSNQSLLLDKL
jgi:hypothetical protein